jgi:2'-5' RNA ligase
MRSFIAIDFDIETKKLLYQKAKQKLDSYCTSYKIIDATNIHMTIHFLGEIDGDDMLIKSRLVKQIGSAKKFSIIISGWGYFPSKSGSIIWLGIKENNELFSIANKIRKEFHDINYEIRPFLPHITVSRYAKCIKNADDWVNYDDVVIDVGKISLMRTDFINNKVRYTEICSCKLK